ncbi:MAG: hypothetical protein JWM11_6643 [Planctomycetaceae bacterium]|nr:hypothetical protein [Planctomycetaceae bacterium]
MSPVTAFIVSWIVFAALDDTKETKKPAAPKKTKATKAAKVPNAPEKDRDAIAELLKKELIKELVDKKLKGTADQGLGPFKVMATADFGFVDPKKNLKVKVTTLENHGAKGWRMVALISNPLEGTLQGAGPGIQADARVKSELESRIVASIKLKPVEITKLSAEIEVTEFDGKVKNVKSGNADLDNLLGPLVEQAANNIITNNRDELKKEANRALKKAAEDGKLIFGL